MKFRILAAVLVLMAMACNQSNQQPSLLGSKNLPPTFFEIDPGKDTMTESDGQMLFGKLSFTTGNQQLLQLRLQPSTPGQINQQLNFPEMEKGSITAERLNMLMKQRNWTKKRKA